MRNNNALFIIGLVLLIAGAAVLVYGVIQYSDVSKEVFPSLGKSLLGITTEKENQAKTLMITGGAGALLGFVLLVVSRRRR